MNLEIPDDVQEERTKLQDEETRASDDRGVDPSLAERDATDPAKDGTEAESGEAREPGEAGEVQEAPPGDAPGGDAPDSDAPDSDAPDSDAPDSDAPNSDAPNSDEPEPVAEAPNEPEPVVTEPEEDEDDSYEWFVLRVQSGREDTVSNNLRKKLVLAKMDHLVKEIAVPKQKLTEIKEGKKKIREQKLFPGYVFLHMVLEDELWYLIRDTSGIGDFVGSHHKPIPMPKSEVHKILQMMEEKEEPQEVKIDLEKNDPVKIKEGPFENFDGVVDEVHPSKGMVRVMVSIFGRSTPVDLEYWQVEKL